MPESTYNHVRSARLVVGVCLRHDVMMNTNINTNLRRRSIQLGGGILILLVLVIIACEMIGWPFLRQPLQQLLQEQLKRQVVIERPFRLQLFGGVDLNVGQLKIAALQGFDAPFLVDAHGLRLALRYSDVWQLKEDEAFRIKAIRADRLDAHLTRHANGSATWQFELDNNGPQRPFPIIEALSISQGQAQVSDAVSQAELSVKFYTEEGAHMAVPESHVKLSGKFRQRPLNGELITHGFLPVATSREDTPAINSEGWLNYGKVKATFRGAVNDIFGQQRIKGAVHVKGPSLADVGDLLDLTFPRTPAFNIAAEVERGVNLWQVAVPSATIGQSQLSGQFAYDSKTSKPKLTGELKGAKFVLADLAPAFGAPKEIQSVPDKPKADRMFPDTPLDFGSYDRMNADINVHLDAVDLGSAFKERISPLALHLILQDNKLTLTDLDARTAQGRLGGEFSIDAHAPIQAEASTAAVVPDWDMQLTLNDIRLENWLKVSPSEVKQTAGEQPAVEQTQPKHQEVGKLQRQGQRALSQQSSPVPVQEATTPKASPSQLAAPQNKSQPAPAYISGIINGKAALHGRGRSTAALLSTLDGQVALLINNGEISHLIVEAAGLDIAQAVGVLLTGDQSMPMQCAAMGWRAKQGVLTPEAALIDTKVTTVTVSGDIDLGREWLDLKLQASPKNFSPLTIRSPILVTGQFIDPKVSISPGPVVARVAGGVLLAMLNPFAAILPFLDPGSSAQSEDIGCQQTLKQLSVHK